MQTLTATGRATATAKNNYCGLKINERTLNNNTYRIYNNA